MVAFADGGPAPPMPSASAGGGAAAALVTAEAPAFSLAFDPRLALEAGAHMHSSALPPALGGGRHASALSSSPFAPLSGAATAEAAEAAEAAAAPSAAPAAPAAAVAAAAERSSTGQLAAARQFDAWLQDAMGEIGVPESLPSMDFEAGAAVGVAAAGAAATAPAWGQQLQQQPSFASYAPNPPVQAGALAQEFFPSSTPYYVPPPQQQSYGGAPPPPTAAAAPMPPPPLQHQQQHQPPPPPQLLAYDTATGRYVPVNLPPGVSVPALLYAAGAGAAPPAPPALPPPPMRVFGAQPGNGNNNANNNANNATTTTTTRPASAAAAPSRFRERQRQQIAQLEGEVEARLLQVRALAEQNEALKVKARVLESAVAGRERQAAFFAEHGTAAAFAQLSIRATAAVDGPAAPVAAGNGNGEAAGGCGGVGDGGGGSGSGEGARACGGVAKGRAATAKGKGAAAAKGKGQQQQQGEGDAAAAAAAARQDAAGGCNGNDNTNTDNNNPCDAPAADPSAAPKWTECDSHKLAMVSGAEFIARGELIPQAVCAQPYGVPPAVGAASSGAAATAAACGVGAAATGRRPIVKREEEEEGGEGACPSREAQEAHLGGLEPLIDAAEARAQAEAAAIAAAAAEAARRAGRSGSGEDGGADQPRAAPAAAANNADNTNSHSNGQSNSNSNNNTAAATSSGDHALANNAAAAARLAADRERAASEADLAASAAAAAAAAEPAMRRRARDLTGAELRTAWREFLDSVGAVLAQAQADHERMSAEAAARGDAPPLPPHDCGASAAAVVEATSSPLQAHPAAAALGVRPVRCTVAQRRVAALVAQAGWLVRHVALLNPGAMLRVQTVHLESGRPTDEHPPPPGHWRRVVRAMGVTPPQRRELRESAALYARLVGRALEEQRRAARDLVAACEASSPPSSDDTAAAAGVPPAPTPALAYTGTSRPAMANAAEEALDRMAAALRREQNARLLLNCLFWGRALSGFQFAAAALHSFPFFPDTVALAAALQEEEEGGGQEEEEEGREEGAGAKGRGKGRGAGAEPPLPVLLPTEPRVLLVKPPAPAPGVRTTRQRAAAAAASARNGGGAAAMVF